MASVSRYVPELDGLRGIAILAVIVHHQLTPFYLSGGFLGVDLFFVLSGFLITGLLLDEFERTGSISLRNFYMRRILRLGPALVLYLLASLVVSYHRQLISVTSQIKMIVMALLYSTNWRLALGWDSTLDPTAIIWSLSIEEQFYLVWPLLMIGALVLKLKRRFIVTGLGLTILAVMFHRCLLSTDAIPLTRLYYGTDTRADALLVGCLLALMPITAVGRRARSWLNLASIFSAVGLVYLIFASSFSDIFLYRGGFTLVAMLAAILICIAVNSPPQWLSVVLKSSPLRWFGRISYGLYLWHWLVVQNTSLYYLGYWEPWGRLAIALGIASASFYLVERPFNRLKNRYGILPGIARSDTRLTTPHETISPISIPLPNYESSITSN